MEEKRNFKSSMMTGNQLAIYQVESFLEESYLFRRNVLNGKTEFICIKPVKELEEEEPENSEEKENSEIKEISGEKELEKKEVTQKKEENPERKPGRFLQLRHSTPSYAAPRNWESASRSRQDRTSRSTSSRMPFPFSTLSGNT